MVLENCALEKVILRSLGELTQFRDGLQCLGVGKAITDYRQIRQEFYVKTKDSKLTTGIFFFFFYCLGHSFYVDIIRRILKVVKFSENGLNAHNREENAYMLFLDYLDVREKGV